MHRALLCLLYPAVVVSAIQPLEQPGPSAERLPESWGRSPTYGYNMVDPQVCKSPAGKYTLHMKPLHRTGQYAAVYKMVSGGKVVWSGQRDYTLRQIVVIDKGFVVGFAYSLLEQRAANPPGPDELAYPDPDYFCLVIIDPQGNELLKDVALRCLPMPLPNIYGFVPARPFAMQLIVDPENDRVVVQVGEWEKGCVPDASREIPFSPPKTIWKIYKLSTGRAIGRFDEHPLVGPPKVKGSLKGDGVVDAVVVPGTPLLLMHAVLQFGTSRTWAARFILVDEQGRQVWTMDVPDDYTGREAIYGPWESMSQTHLRDNPAILRVQDPGRFHLRLFKRNERVTFSVSRAKDKWIVTEVSRVDYVKQQEGRIKKDREAEP